MLIAVRYIKFNSVTKLTAVPILEPEGSILVAVNGEKGCG